MMGTGPGTYGPAASAPFRVPVGLNETPPYFTFRPDQSQPVVHIYGRFRPDGGSMESARITFDYDNLSFSGFTPIDDVNFQIRDMTDIDSDSMPSLVASFTSEIRFWEHEPPGALSNTLLLDLPFSTDTGQFFATDLNGDEETDLLFLTLNPNQTTSFFWLMGPTDLSNLDFQSITLDSVGYASMVHQARIFSSVPDLVTLHEHDRTLRIFANGMGPVPTQEILKHGEEVRVFPNPANDYFELQAGGMTIRQVNIFSAQGQWVHTQFPESQPIIIQTSGWAPGLYFIRVSNEKGATKTVKVVVTR